MLHRFFLYLGDLELGLVGAEVVLYLGDPELGWVGAEVVLYPR